MADTYYTIDSVGEGVYREKMSKFMAFAVPVSTATEAREVIATYTNRYHDARHVCWAYMVGAARTEYLSSDNGEPSGTAGKPILGQINSFNLTNVVVIVVRYFGGIKLGTSGLIVAYREAAREAITASHIIECHEQAEVSFTFPYLAMEPVMRLVKNTDGLKVLDQQFDNSCSMRVQLRADHEPEFRRRLADISGLTFS
ncbi:MAG: YigZ family protein [Muribaculaceae bacterium]|nr:YigZ family protein [Muribaculaceae bacterium]